MTSQDVGLCGCPWGRTCPRLCSRGPAGWLHPGGPATTSVPVPPTPQGDETQGRGACSVGGAWTPRCSEQGLISSVQHQRAPREREFWEWPGPSRGSPCGSASIHVAHEVDFCGSSSSSGVSAMWLWPWPRHPPSLLFPTVLVPFSEEPGLSQSGVGQRWLGGIERGHGQLRPEEGELTPGC